MALAVNEEFDIVCSAPVGVALGLIVESAVAVISVGVVVPEQVPAGIVHATEHSETATTRLFVALVVRRVAAVAVSTIER